MWEIGLFRKREREREREIEKGNNVLIRVEKVADRVVVVRAVTARWEARAVAARIGD